MSAFIGQKSYFKTVKPGKQAMKYQDQGKKAFIRGTGIEDCPFQGYAKAHWIKGWESARKEYI